MSRTNVYIVTDDHEMLEKAKAQLAPMGIEVHSFFPNQWKDGLDNPNFRSQIGGGAATNSNTESRGNVLPFPGMSSYSPANTAPTNVVDSKVATMNELESKAIENAILQFRGNLTEAAKALGIGRATLYRKVKQYQIDPTQARKKRAA